MIELTLDNNISTLEIYDLSLIKDVAVRVEDGLEYPLGVRETYEEIKYKLAGLVNVR